MSDHRSDKNPSLPQKEPPALAEIIRLVLLALVGLGWITIDSTTLTAIASALGVIASVALTLFARMRVTPEAKPRASDGRPLVPAAPPTTLGKPPEPPVSP